MSSHGKRTGDPVIFLLLTVLLGCGIFLASSAERIPFAGILGWLIAIALLGASIGLFLRRFPVRLLLLALPLATLLAWGLSSRIWPDRGLLAGRGDERPPEGLVLTPVRDAPSGLEYLYAPPGTCMGVFAQRLKQPRMLLFLADGWLLVSEPSAGRVTALKDRDGDGVAETRKVFARDLDRPHGLALGNRGVFVAETGRILRLTDADGDHVADRTQVVSTDLPAGGGHWTRSLAVATDGTLFVSIGSDCNACLEADPRRGTIMRFDSRSGQGELYASGLRNSVGMAIQPSTGELWASDNGRDFLGDDIPADEINRIVPGGDYGWPWCYGNRVPDPELGNPQRCQSTLPAKIALAAHVAPLGLTFGDGLVGPKDWRDDLFVAEHGSWNRSVPVGYQLVRVPFDGSEPAGSALPLVTGWLRSGRVWGRPVDTIVGPDGALYVSDDHAGVIYRVIFHAEGEHSCDR